MKSCVVEDKIGGFVESMNDSESLFSVIQVSAKG